MFELEPVTLGIKAKLRSKEEEMEGDLKCTTKLVPKALEVALRTTKL